MTCKADSPVSKASLSLVAAIQFHSHLTTCLRVISAHQSVQNINIYPYMPKTF